MRIYPAIDLISGKAVRLEQGDYAKMTQYSDNPADVAKQFAEAGAEYIHMVDLDGAKAKRPLNTGVIKQVSGAVNIPIQVGGGVRTEESAGLLLEYADRVIIGTVAVTDPAMLKRLIKKFGAKKIIVSVDYKDGQPSVNGWLEKVPLDTGKLQSQLQKSGVK
ncbi:MAG TPA: 1-(5-phosphoribosyl)-5-[(5-phosphoribosylamino)methylideneamino] imidazole-4-carboxamide isomerase, partial [Candidatus Saccharimonadales bacterium]|nr:1-(5-phosphoribosyl)-5-[(5-phosphoribosylamino)methylideneamino] imidazole-4-carboxamide isomerase [Candidatus Saccharimonadales bacterium]